MYILYTIASIAPRKMWKGRGRKRITPCVSSFPSLSDRFSQKQSRVQRQPALTKRRAAVSWSCITLSEECPRPSSLVSMAFSAETASSQPNADSFLCQRCWQRQLPSRYARSCKKPNHKIMRQNCNVIRFSLFMHCSCCPWRSAQMRRLEGRSWGGGGAT